jgi:hypothetical protein
MVLMISLMVEEGKLENHINLTGLATGLVAFCGPMHLCACVSEGDIDPDRTQTWYRNHKSKSSQDDINM